MIAKNWDSTAEMISRDNELNVHWENFLNLSNWTDKNPNNQFDYTLSQDALWWYTTDSSFFGTLGDLNPSEDWSTIWVHYFTVGRNSADAEIQGKLDHVDDFFDKLNEL